MMLMTYWPSNDSSILFLLFFWQLVFLVITKCSHVDKEQFTWDLFYVSTDCTACDISFHIFAFTLGILLMSHPLDTFYRRFVFADANDLGQCVCIYECQQAENMTKACKKSHWPKSKYGFNWHKQKSNNASGQTTKTISLFASAQWTTILYFRRYFSLSTFLIVIAWMCHIHFFLYGFGCAFLMMW